MCHGGARSAGGHGRNGLARRRLLPDRAAGARAKRPRGPQQRRQAAPAPCSPPPPRTPCGAPAPCVRAASRCIARPAAGAAGRSRRGSPRATRRRAVPCAARARSQAGGGTRARASGHPPPRAAPPPLPRWRRVFSPRPPARGVGGWARPPQCRVPPAGPLKQPARPPRRATHRHEQPRELALRQRRQALVPLKARPRQPRAHARRRTRARRRGGGRRRHRHRPTDRPTARPPAEAQATDSRVRPPPPPGAARGPPPHPRGASRCRSSTHALTTACSNKGPWWSFLVIRAGHN